MPNRVGNSAPVVPTVRSAADTLAPVVARPVVNPADSFRVRPATPTTLSVPATGDYELYAAMVRRAGGKVNPNGQPTVLGIRTQTDRSTKYQDQIVVLTADHQVKVFKGSTVPSFKNSSDAPDINHDGIYDVGVIKPGNYNVGPHRDFLGGNSYELNGAGGVPGWRETDGDGVFSDTEKQASDTRGDKLGGVLFHRGMPDRPMSVGCITLAPTDFDRLVDAVGGKKAKFNFTLVDLGG